MFNYAYKDPLDNSEWKCLENLHKILKPCKDATIFFQKQDVILSSIYKEWQKCILLIKEMSMFLIDL